jgi:hypothetical protein
MHTIHAACGRICDFYPELYMQCILSIVLILYKYLESLDSLKRKNIVQKKIIKLESKIKLVLNHCPKQPNPYWTDDMILSLQKSNQNRPEQRLKSINFRKYLLRL